MRRAVATVAVVLGLAGLAACSALAGESADSTVKDDPTDGRGAAECVADSDCAAAGDSCCDCPSYAIPASSGWDDSCEDVSCQEPRSCSHDAACDQGQCVLRCAVLSCDADASCAGGFARDAAGCLSCACAATPDPGAAECQLDADCVQAPADCCGCSQGGADTALPLSEAGSFQDSLACDGAGTCPGVDVCDPALGPRCVAGSCLLVASSDTPGDQDGSDGGVGAAEQLCGTPELAPCPAGQSCVVNDPDSAQASEMDVGICI